MMKKYLLISILIIFGFTQFSYSAGKAKIISEDISDLIVKGFEVFDVSVTEKKIFYSFNSLNLLDNLSPSSSMFVSLSFG